MFHVWKRYICVAPRFDIAVNARHVRERTAGRLGFARVGLVTKDNVVDVNKRTKTMRKSSKSMFFMAALIEVVPENRTGV